MKCRQRICDEEALKTLRLITAKREENHNQAAPLAERLEQISPTPLTEALIRFMKFSGVPY